MVLIRFRFRVRPPLHHPRTPPRDHIIPSQLMSLTSLGVVRQSCLVFDNVINIPGLDEKFSLAVEVHGLQRKSESIEHDVKYHIKKVSYSRLTSISSYGI
jgi:hypothetical protein